MSFAKANSLMAEPTMAHMTSSKKFESKLSFGFRDFFDTKYSDEKHECNDYIT